jgi:hypothetical protein
LNKLQKNNDLRRSSYVNLKMSKRKNRDGDSDIELDFNLLCITTTITKKIKRNRCCDFIDCDCNRCEAQKTNAMINLFKTSCEVK